MPLDAAWAHFQVRFGGEEDFRYWDLILDYGWPKYDIGIQLFWIF